jgi:hypothetical protein
LANLPQNNPANNGQSTPAPKDLLTLDPENRLPVARYQYVNVLFEKADHDVDIRHNLNPVNPETVRYKVCRLTSGASIYQDQTPNRKPWQRTHIWLRASVPTAARILLFLEPAEEETIDETPAVEEPCYPFSIIHVPDQESVDADSICGEVTYVAGNGITITTDAESNRIRWDVTCCDDDETPVGDECRRYCTTTGMRSAPSAADGALVTPSGSAWVSGSWSEIEAAAAEDWILTGVTYKAPSTAKNVGNYFEIDIGIGDAGNESVISTICGLMGSNSSTAADPQNYFPFPIPADVVSAGMRVSARLRQVDADTGDWNVGINYFAKPLEEDEPLPTSSVGPTCWPIESAPISISPNTSAWADSAWHELTSATGSEWFLGGLQIFAPTSEWEIDVGIGDSGSEVVVTTLRGVTDYLFRAGGGYHQMFQPILDAIPEGVRVAVRQRKSGTSATVTTVKAIFSRERVRSMTTAQPMKVWPPAADGLAVSNGGGWVEFVAATATDTAIVAIAHGRDNASPNIEIGVGSAGSEEVVATFTVGAGVSTAGGWQRNIDLPFGKIIPAGSRVAVRLDSGTRTIALQYIEDPDFTNTTTDIYDMYGVANPNPPGVWTDSTWVEIIDPVASDIRLVGGVPSGLTDNEYEFDWGIGAAGSEVVITTMRLAAGASSSGSGARWLRLPVPHCVDAGVRLAIRVRSSDGSSGGFTTSYLTNNDDTVPDCGPEGVEGEEEGDIGLPSSSTDNAIVRWDGTLGDTIQNSGITIADGATGTLSGTNSGDQDLFASIEVSGEATVTADGPTEILTLVAGSPNIAITTDNTAKEITFTVSAGGGVGNVNAGGVLTNNALVIGQGSTDVATTATGTGILTALGINTGSAGAPVLFNGALGTPSSGTLTNATGLPIATGVSGLGTGVATALAVNIGSAGAPVVLNGAGGTPSSLTLTNATGLPLSTGVTGDLPFANFTQASAASKLLGRGSASGAGDYEEISLGSNLTMTGTTLSATASVSVATRTVGITIDGGGSAITTGVKGYIQVPYSGTISKWTLLADQTGDIVIDVWVEDYAGALPDNTDSITGGNEPEISGNVKATDSTLTGWGTTVTAGDVFGFNVDSATDIERVTLTIEVVV